MWNRRVRSYYTEPMLRQIFSYLSFVVRRFFDDRCLTIAGSLTYTSLLALVPVFTVFVTLSAAIPATRETVMAVKAFILKALVPDVAGKTVAIYMEQFAQNASRLTQIGVLIIVATAVALLFTIDSAFNDIWRARRTRNLWKRLAAYIALLIFGPLLIGASLTATSYLVRLSRQLDPILPFLDDVLLRVIPFLLSTLALVLAYKIMPVRYVPLRHALGGGMVAAILFEAMKYLFVMYVGKVPTYSMVYGTFASVPIFLVWLYCCWVVVLIGAEIAATFSYARHITAQKNGADLADATAILDALAVAGVPIPFEGVRVRAPMPIDHTEDLLDHLIAAGLVLSKTSRTSRTFYLAKPRAEIDTASVLAALHAARRLF